MSVRAIEFFSGIGAFAQASKNNSIEIVQAFDQSDDANKVYEHNWALTPQSINLESIKSKQIKDAEFWWLSPPCTPFSVRGKRADDRDRRAYAFLNLIGLIAEGKPEHIAVENVDGFLDSNVHKFLKKQLKLLGYRIIDLKLCSTQFNVPMRRPRLFVVASRKEMNTDLDFQRDERVLADYLKFIDDDSLKVDPAILTRYRQALNIVELNGFRGDLICFTAGYFRSTTASGSLLKLENGDVKYVHPLDIASLMGFSDEFSFPAEIAMKTKWKLVGNTVDVRAIKHVLKMLGLV